jgi:hypothetical protein
MAGKRWSIRLVAAGVAPTLMLGGTLAWAAAKPKPGGSYFSTSPSVEIFVQKGSRAVTLYTSCGSGTSISAYWDSPKLPLRNGAFSFDKQTTVDEVQDRPFSTTPVKASVLFTGSFKGDKFTGKVHLGGSTCPEASYSARFSTRGGGSGGGGA